MKKHFATYTCCVSLAVVAMSITMLSPLLSQISARFGLTVGQSGLLLTVNFIGFALFTLIGGAFSERFGRKRVLNVCGFGLAGAAMLLSITQNFFLVLVLMFIYGGCGGAIETFISALISDLNPEHSAYYINLSQVFFGIGAIIAPVATGFLLQAGVQYTVCYMVLGVLALVCAVVFSQVKVPVSQSEQGITLRDVKVLFGSKTFWLVCLCMCCYTGAEVGTWGWMSTFLGQNFAFSALNASLALASFWVAMTVGRFLCGKLSRFIELKRFTLGLAVAAALAAVLLSVSGRSMFFFAAFLLGLACSSQLPFIMAYGEKNITRAKNTAFSLFLVSSNIGSITIPYFIGRVSERAGVSAAMLVPAVFFVIVAVVFAGMCMHEKRANTITN